MSFAGFVFDMIRRDKENRNLRTKGMVCHETQQQKTWKR